MSDILALDATAQLQALEAKRVGALELLEACQGALNSRNVRLNAVVAADFERAQERARAIDDHRARSDHLGPLAGLPMTIKDSFDVEGLPASAGQEALRRRRAPDAKVAALVRAKDAVLWGKTNVPLKERDWQTAGGLFGTTNNPYDLSMTAGGSSGGSAAAVAAGLSALEIGSDAAGGLRIPASFCGVFAHRPTEGLADNRGHVPPQPGSMAERDLLCPGPMARSARDLRLLLACMSEGPLPARADPYDLRELKVGLWLDEPAMVLDSEVRTVIEAFADELAGQGTAVRALSAPVDPGGLLSLFAELLGMAEAGDLTRGRYALEVMARPAAAALCKTVLSPWSWAGDILGHTAPHRAWLAAHEARIRMRQAARSAFAACHVIIAPCVGIAAFPHLKPGGPLRTQGGRRIAYSSLAQWSALGSVCGLPATVVPVGLTAAGLPVAVQIIGPRGADSRTLAVAEALDGRILSFVPPARPQDL